MITKTKISVMAVVLLGAASCVFVSCGKGSNIKKILRNDATTASMNWLERIEENGINYEWKGSTLLGEAIKAGRVDMVEALIKDDADVNRPALYADIFGIGQRYGIPPLLLATFIKDAASRILLEIRAPQDVVNDICILLIDAGAQIKTEDLDFIFFALGNLDEDVFKTALSKYNSKMLDYSLHGKEEYEKGRFPFNNIFSDERFESQKEMLAQLCKKGIQFGFFDIHKALEYYLSPGLYTYGNQFLRDIIEYMSNQKGFTLISVAPYNFDEHNPLFINPLDLVINKIYTYKDGNNLISTSPNYYFYFVDLFGSKGLKATPYDWSIKNISSSGTLPLFMDIIAARINQEIKHRNPNNYSYSRAEQDAEVHILWNPERIITAFDLLNKYDALYHTHGYREGGNNLDDSYPPDYLYKTLTTRYNGVFQYNDLFEPYYPVFEWLEKNGYIKDGVKEYLVYEDGLDRDKFFSSYNRRIRDKGITANDRNDPSGVTIEFVRRKANEGDWGFKNMVLPEAEEIIRGERKGFSDEVQDFLYDRGLGTNLKY